MSDEATLRGFALGDYSSRCVACNEMFTGDKRAIGCFRCAASEAKHEIATLQSQLNQQEEALGVLREALREIESNANINGSDWCNWKAGSALATTEAGG